MRLNCNSIYYSPYQPNIWPCIHLQLRMHKEVRVVAAACTNISIEYYKSPANCIYVSIQIHMKLINLYQQWLCWKYMPIFNIFTIIMNFFPTHSSPSKPIQQTSYIHPNSSRHEHFWPISYRPTKGCKKDETEEQHRTKNYKKHNKKWKILSLICIFPQVLLC